MRLWAKIVNFAPKLNVLWKIRMTQFRIIQINDSPFTYSLLIWSQQRWRNLAVKVRTHFQYFWTKTGNNLFIHSSTNTNATVVQHKFVRDYFLLWSLRLALIIVNYQLCQIHNISPWNDQQDLALRLGNSSCYGLFSVSFDEHQCVTYSLQTLSTSVRV